MTRWDLGAAVGVGYVSCRGSGGGVAETAGLSVISNSPSARLRGEQCVPAGLRACSGHRAQPRAVVMTRRLNSDP